MAVLFIKLNVPYDEVGNLVFSALGFSNFAESETTFNTKGYYFTVDILGLSVKVEENCYDCEEQYNCIISIEKSRGTKLTNDIALEGVAEVVASVLVAKLKTEVVLELEMRIMEQDPYKHKIFYYENDEVHTEIRTYPNK